MQSNAVKVMQNDSTYRIVPVNSSISHDVLPAKVYQLQFSPTMGFYLEVVTPITVPGKIYSNTVKHARRMVDTFVARDKNTGVLLAGEKGSGKTLLAKMVCKLGLEQNIPVILINIQAYGADFSMFVNSLPNKVILMFDEFEKVYAQENQEHLLTLLDGTGTSKAMFLFTVNDQYRISHYLSNRPGRIYYKIAFDGNLDEQFVREYCEDNLKDKSHITAIIKMTQIMRKFNFDMLLALVEEMNRYNESPLDAIKLLNIEFSDDASRFDAKMTYKGKEVEAYESQLNCNPLTLEYDMYYTIPSGDEDVEDEEGRFRIEPRALTTFNMRDGLFVFGDNKGIEVILTRQTPKLRTFGDYLDD